MTNREWLNTLSDEEFAELVDIIDCNIITKECPIRTKSLSSCRECRLNWFKAQHNGIKEDIESIIKDKTWTIETLAQELENMGYKK